MEIKDYVNGLCAEVREAQLTLALATSGEKNAALIAISKALIDEKDAIISANERDIADAEKNGVPRTMIDRLKLTEERV